MKYVFWFIGAVLIIDGGIVFTTFPIAAAFCIVLGIIVLPPVFDRLPFPKWTAYLAVVAGLSAFMSTQEKVGDAKPLVAPTESVNVSADANTADYKVLNETRPGNFSNYVILVPSKVSEPEMLMMAQRVKLTECAGKTCNVITFWNDKHQYELYLNKQDDRSWRKKHWTAICEANTADYVASVNEFVFYPMLDSEYRKYGGKKKRPAVVSYNL